MTEREKQELVITKMMDNDGHALKSYVISREETDVDLETLFDKMKRILVKKDTKGCLKKNVYLGFKQKIALKSKFLLIGPPRICL